jgi:serine O-acetyltransferase
VDPIESTAKHLLAQREKRDPISAAARERVPDRRQVLEVLHRLHEILLDHSAAGDLESDLHVVHGLLSGIIGQAAATRMVERLPEVRGCLALDVEAAYHGDPASTSYAEIVAAYPSIQAVFTFRVAHALYELGHPVVARIMAEDAHGRTGIDIHPGAQIGCHFFIDHGTGVVIGETTVIGNRVKLYHGVTLGAFSNRRGREDRGSKRHPTIEDDVTIYPNATVLGGETVIGSGSVIGGNAWVTRSVPPHNRVTAEPAHLVLSEGGAGASDEDSLDWDI